MSGISELSVQFSIKSARIHHHIRYEPAPGGSDSRGALFSSGHRVGVWLRKSSATLSWVRQTYRRRLHHLFGH